MNIKTSSMKRDQLRKKMMIWYKTIKLY